MSAAALTLARHGYAVFPAWPRGKNPVITKAHPGDPQLQKTCQGRCGHDGHGRYDATSDLERIAGWWRRWPRANILIRCDTWTDLLVIDIDPRAGGTESLHQLELEHGPLNTLEVHTGGGGTHFYLQRPKGPLVYQLAPGVEIPTAVIAPPSLHASGLRYSWAEGCQPDPQPIPEEWLRALRRPEPQPRVQGDVHLTERLKKTHGSRVDAYWYAALDREVQRVAAIPIGEKKRYLGLRKAALKMGNLKHLGADLDTVSTELLKATSLDESEAAALIDSAFEFGARSPYVPAWLAEL